VNIMARKVITLGLAIAAILAAGIAFGDDLASRAVREREQQSDAFALQLQQSLQNPATGTLGPRERLELDAIQRGQRQRQDELFYRQQVETNSPESDALRRAETMRAEQERQQQLSQFRSDAASALGGQPAARRRVPFVDPTVVTAPIPRSAVDAGTASATSADRTGAGALAEVRRIEDQADALWQAALQGDWRAAQDALDGVRRGVDALRSERFAADYSDSGGRMGKLSDALAQLDKVVAEAERQVGARDAASVMRRADEAMFAAGHLVPALDAPVGAGRR
jgi:hypothetical protein